MKFALVYLSTFTLDLVWVGYTIAIEKRRIWSASLAAGVIMYLTGYAVVSYVDNHELIWAAVGGAMGGTYFALKLPLWSCQLIASIKRNMHG